MAEIVGLLLGAKAKTLFVVAGIAFLGVAVLGDVQGRIQPGRIGRIAAALLGLALLGGGVAIHTKGRSDSARVEAPETGVEGSRARESGATSRTPGSHGRPTPPRSTSR